MIFLPEYFLLQYVLNDLLSFEISLGTRANFFFFERVRTGCSCENWQGVLVLLVPLHDGGEIFSSNLGIMISVVLKRSLLLSSGTFLRIVIIGKKLEELFLLCNQIVWKKVIMKSHLMNANRTLIM